MAERRWVDNVRLRVRAGDDRKYTRWFSAFTIARADVYSPESPAIASSSSSSSPRRRDRERLSGER